MNAKIITAVSALLAANLFGAPALFAQNQMPSQSRGSMGSGTMQGGGMQEKNPSNMGGGDMNKMMADCDKMMKDKGMQMSGSMQQRMDQCSKMMKSPGESSKAR